MVKVLVEVSRCSLCPYYDVEYIQPDYIRKSDFCMKADKEIRNTLEIPEWCPFIEYDKRSKQDDR
jgi:hypothetical protein